jgi:ABC-type multidrug transport system fused ATPase/permease subunit
MGEGQRLTIARALVKEPRLIILNEATASLDAESEASVQAALEHLTQGRTTFVIAHRLFTVVDATRIIMLRDGRVKECGTRGELMTYNGCYASLVARQLWRLILNAADWDRVPQRESSSESRSAEMTISI